ncbi:MAG: hypothetical protein ACFFET_10615 [Candidatus Thorarchaeota archaeon]
MPESPRTPPAVGRVEETLTIIEEIDARLNDVKKILSFIDAESRRLEGLSIRDHFNTIEEIGNTIDAIEVEVNVLETRIATIESLKKHQK